SLSKDEIQLQEFVRRSLGIIQEIWQPPGRWFFLFFLLCALIILAKGHWVIVRFLKNIMPRFPEGHLRRSIFVSGLAFGRVDVIGLALGFIYFGTHWNDWSDPDVDALITQVNHSALAAAWLIGLGSALLSVHHVSWRLPRISHETALALRPFPGLLAI